MEAGSMKAEISEGEFKRQEDHFKNWVTRDGSSGYKAEPGRYHLYVSLACPWAHRTIIVRRLKKLEEVISMSVVDPIRDDDSGWAFRDGPGYSQDAVNGFAFLAEAYRASEPGYSARVTVPVLWDKQEKRIVSNDDDDILRMFNSEFNDCSESALDLYLEALRGEIDAVNGLVYPGVADTVDFDHIKRHYYYTHDDINPFRIVPVGPELDFSGPHGRDGRGQ
jgi:putative glutathione S-transferase